MFKFLLTVLFAVTSNVYAQVVKIDGSSTVFPITEGIAEDFQKKEKVKVTVGISGTGGGFKKFCRGEIDIQNASRPILQKEIDDCKAAGIEYYELPIAFDALTVVVSPRNTFITQLTVEELKKMWEPAAQSRITHWNQINPAWPNRPIKLFGAGSDSGTFDYFTEAIVGKAKSSRGDYTASEDDNVLVTGVSGDAYGLAYFGYAYYAENTAKLRAVPIVNKVGKAVPPSTDTVMNGSYNPLARPIFIYVSAKALEKPEVRKMVEYYMTNAAKIAREVKYVELPAMVYKANLDHIARKRVGTIFGGKNEVGLTIEELVKREVKK